MEYCLFHSIDQVTIKGKNEVIEDIYNLWKEAFGDSDAYMDFYFEWKIGKNQVLLIYKGLELVAMLNLNPYQLSTKLGDLPSNYIVGVATKESERRKGLMSRLLDGAMDQMYNEKMPFTYLMPANESIYLPFDFTVVYEQDLWNDKLAKVKDKALTKDGFKILVLEPEDEGKIDDLVRFTNSILKEEYDIFVKRNPYYYKRLISEMRSALGEVLLYYYKDKLIGYLSYMAEEVIYITELVTSLDYEEDLLENSLAHLSSVRDLNVFKRKAGSQATVIMARIINLEAFIERLRAKSSISLVIDVNDPIIEKNNGRFLINIDEEGGRALDTSKEPDISINIADLGQLLFGKLESEGWDKFTLKDNEKVKAKIKEIKYPGQIFINDVV